MASPVVSPPSVPGCGRGMPQAEPRRARRSGPSWHEAAAGRIEIGSGQSFESGRSAPASIVPQRKEA